MKLKVALPLVLVLVSMLFSCVEPSLADGNVGVVVGQTSDYTYALSGTERDSDGNLSVTVPFIVRYLETITIQEISGNNVTFEYVRDFLNGTEETGLSWINVSDGDGTGFFVVVAANLNAGDMIYPDWTNANGTSVGAPCINDTVRLKYGDSTIEANHFGYTYTVDDQPCYEDYYWEKSSGLLIKYILSGSEVVNVDSVQFLSLHFQEVGLEQVFYPLIDSDEYPVVVDSKSTIMGFEYNQTEQKMLLTVTGKTGTSGSCDVAVPNSLLWGTFSLSMDGYTLVKGDDYSQRYNGTHYIFHISYIHSSHTIEISALNDGSVDDVPIDEEPETPDNEQPEEPETPDNEETTDALISTEAAILIAVAVACVIGAVAFWALRKRK